MAGNKVLAEIKEGLDTCVGKRVKLKANRGRKKVVERVGVLEQTYPNVFVVLFEEKRNAVRRVSFSYADVLTEIVKLSMYNEEEEEIQEEDPA